MHAGWGHIDLSGVSFVPRAIHIEELGTQHTEVVWPADQAAADRTAIAYVYFDSPPEGQPRTGQVEVRGEPGAQVVFGASGGRIG